MKHKWKKQEKEIHGIKTKPCVADVPAQRYIIVSDNRNSSDEIFSDEAAALFSMTYKIRMAQEVLAERSSEITDYAAYPLEGIWSMASKKSIW